MASITCDRSIDGEGESSDGLEVEEAVAPSLSVTMEVFEAPASTGQPAFEVQPCDVNLSRLWLPAHKMETVAKWF